MDWLCPLMSNRGDEIGLQHHDLRFLMIASVTTIAMAVPIPIAAPNRIGPWRSHGDASVSSQVKLAIILSNTGLIYG